MSGAAQPWGPDDGTGLDQSELAAKKQRDEEERVQTALMGIVGELTREADRRVQRRQTVEKRWIVDLRQLHGEYDPTVVKDLDKAKKSTLYINQTRPKANALEARLSDMLFPTDDRNWAIQPTPVPELTTKARDAMAAAVKTTGQANEAVAAGDSGHAQIAVAAQAHADTAAQIQKDLEESKKRAGAMQDEMTDQLVECEYAIQSRDVLKDACSIGTGIMKGPVAATEGIRRAWVPGQNGNYQLSIADEKRPAYYRVDYWGFFPDPDATTLDNSEGDFERYLMNKTQLRRLAKNPGFNKDAIRRLVQGEPRHTLPTYLSELRGITGENQAQIKPQYHVWEYRGPLTGQQLLDLAQALGKAEITTEYQDVDPLDDLQVVLWFCQDEILNVGVHHLDSGEKIYSVYNLEKDPSSIWGHGIPYMMRDSQSALNGAWRMMMDNSGLSSGPQVVVNRDILEPQNGSWDLAPRKVWLEKAGAPAGRKGMEILEITSHQAELEAIIKLAKQFIDDETSMSQIAQGEQGAHTTNTAHGMTLLMNAVNVVFRRMVKNFDDDFTVPNITRLYDWNMQFSPKEYIKGDYRVDARGTSVLLVREVQSQNLMALINMAGNAVVGPLIKVPDLFRKLVQSMMIAADDVVKTDDEIQQEAQAKANQPPPIDPVDATKMKIAAIEADSRVKVALVNRETQLMVMAQKMNITIEQLKADLSMTDMNLSSDERIKAAELSVRTRDNHAAAAPAGGKGASRPPPTRGIPKTRGVRRAPPGPMPTGELPTPTAPTSVAQPEAMAA